MFPIRDDQPKYAPSTVTGLLIAANLLVFLFEASLDPYTRNFLIAKYGLVPAHFHASALLTSMFLHGGWMHVIGNMLFLWAFGRSLEGIMGHTRFLFFYLASGICAGVVHYYLNLDSSIPTVGASGAIAGVMGAYLVKFPRARIVTIVFFVFIFFTTEIPAVFMLGYWFLTQLFSGIGSIAYSNASQGGGTAWFAHIGGFIAGIILVNVLGSEEPQWQRRRVSW
jgi:membrane associated rhomboid family serine protease